MRAWIAAKPAEWKAITARARAKYRRDHPEECLAARTRYHRRIRNEVLAFFGPRCVGCWFENVLALHVDHVNDDGFLERNRYIGRVHKLIAADPDAARRKYQVLCANCNEIKRLVRARKED